MKFINDEFLLENSFSSRLYHDYAENLPIIDYHCHLNPAEVAADLHWENLAQVWLGDDHFKWRAMRSNGVPEDYITGGRTDREKFQKFAETMPYLLRNPLYHWCHLELARYFGIDDLLLSGDSAEEVWIRSGEVLKGGLSARKLMIRSNVVLACTTDDPVDSLEHHSSLAAEGFECRLLPTWRPDKALSIDRGFWNAYMDSLGETAGLGISGYPDLLEALWIRHDFFHKAGCRLSDHDLGIIYASTYTEEEINRIFSRARAGHSISQAEAGQFKTALMLEFARMDAEKNWTQQFHIGALRNNNSRMFKQIGSDTGFDSIGDQNIARPLSTLLDMMNSENSLPKTILYNVNPRDSELIAAMLGNFQDGSTAGKIQMGSGWWFQDQKNGMERQMEILSQMGLLRRFVGMLTDSRSFLSYPRHEYFRRILCNILGRDMEKGLIPRDYDMVGAMVEDISYGNASRFFGFDL